MRGEAGVAGGGRLVDECFISGVDAPRYSHTHTHTYTHTYTHTHTHTQTHTNTHTHTHAHTHTHYSPDPLHNLSMIMAAARMSAKENS